MIEGLLGQTIVGPSIPRRDTPLWSRVSAQGEVFAQDENLAPVLADAVAVAGLALQRWREQSTLKS
jgi:hypothetical protein